MQRLDRKAIKLHPMNPRTIDVHARKRLRESLVRDGLVETLVVNLTTMHLLSGHQRLSLLDEEAGGEDYSLDVAVVRVDEQREREILIRMNSMSLTGMYDFAGLDALIKDAAFPLDKGGLGFDEIDLQTLFPEQTGGLFDATDDKAEPSIEQLKEIKKARRQKNKADDSAEYWVAFVGRDAAHVERFLKALQLDTTQRFHDLTRLADLLGVDLNEPPAG